VREYTANVERLQRTIPDGPERQAALDQLQQEYLAARRAGLSENARANLTQPRVGTPIRRPKPVDRTAEPDRLTAELPRPATYQRGPTTELPRAEQSRRTAKLPEPDALPTQELAPTSAPDVTQRLIERTQARAEELIEQGKFDDAVAELKAHQQALRDAKAKVPRTSAGERVRLEREIGRAGNRIGEVRRMKTEAGKTPKKIPVTPVAQTEAKPPVTPEMLAAENAPMADLPAPPAPSPRTPGGAIIARSSPLAKRRLLPPARDVEMAATLEAPDAPPTGRVQYPDAPDTRETPAIRKWMAAENAPTGELPRIPPIRQTAELAPYRPVRGATVEIPRERQPLRKPTERLPVPKATDENINQLRQRQEELSRVAYDRRGDFTGDLRDELTQLNAHIREYDNARRPH
jgi:hypothetical protein